MKFIICYNKMEINKNTLSMYCIFEDNQNGIIQEGIPLLNSKDISYSCIKKNKGWKKAGVFYTLNKNFRPIPQNMSIFCLKYTEDPYKFTDFSVNYDINFMDDRYTYFVAYNQKVKGTIPLFFYKINDYIFPTLENKDDIWLKYKYVIPVVYVMKYPKNSFECYEGNIIQSLKADKTFYEVLLKCEPQNFNNILQNLEEDQETDNFDTTWIVFFSFLTLVIVAFFWTRIKLI